MKRYTIQPGDSLSAIAHAHGFGSNWKPIFLYNTQVRKNIAGNDPNTIRTGVEIVIPRTAAEYDASITKLQELLTATKRDTEKHLKELGASKKEVDTFMGNLDFAAEIAMIGKSGVKVAIKYSAKKMGARYTKYKIAKETFNAAQKTAIHFSGLQDDSAEKFAVAQLGDRTVDQSIMLAVKGKLNKAKAAKGAGKAVAVKSAQMFARAAAPTDESEAAANFVGLVADAVVAGLDAVKPSAVARLWIRLVDGQDPHDVHRKAVEYCETMGKKSAERLTTAITKLRNEKKLLYVNS